MSGNTPGSILSAIKTTLTASPSLVSGTLRSIKLGIDTEADSGYPYCRVYLLDFGSPVADTVSYERTWTYAVEVWQECTNKTKENAELDFANAVHAVLNRLQATGGTPPTWQLGIGVENLEILPSQIKTVEGPAGPLRVAVIRVVVTTLIQNPS